MDKIENYQRFYMAIVSRLVQDSKLREFKKELKSLLKDDEFLNNLREFCLYANLNYDTIILMVKRNVNKRGWS